MATSTKKIPSTKSSRITVGRSSFTLEPAATRTHYGEHRTIGGGQPYAFPTKRAEDAWFVVSAWDGKKHGLLQQWDDDEWTFSKIESQGQTPSWLRAQARDVPATIVNLSSRLYSGATPEEAIAQALGQALPSGTSHARVKKTMRAKALSENDFRQAAKFEMRRFGLTLPEALRLVKDKRYPGILTTIDDWRGRHGWPAANSALSRGYVFELIGR